METTSKEVAIEPRYNRFKDAPWFKQYEVTVIGMGGIGSWLSVLLTRGGHEIYGYDFDTIEEHNLGGQLFATHQIGMSKTDAVNEMTEALSGKPINGMGRFEESSMVTSIMMVGPDNIRTRKLAAEKFLGMMKVAQASGHMDALGPIIFIDGRMENEIFTIYALNSVERIERYLSGLVPDESIPDAPCTFKATSHNAAIISGMMVGILNNEITNFLQGSEIRDVPYVTRFELPTMTFSTEN